MTAQVLKQLEKKNPGRSVQLRQLYNLFAYEDEPMVDALYVYGGASVGKSAVVTSLLTKLKILHVVVNLIECYAPKVLFETILNKFSGHKIDPDKGNPYAKCDNMMDFLFHFNSCLKETDSDRYVVVLDKAERLRQMDSNLLPSFMKLRELSSLPVSVVFISEIPFEKFHARGYFGAPIRIYFPQYNMEELLRILILDFEHARNLILNNYNFEVDSEFYKNYLNVFLSVFYRACRDISELRHIAKTIFPDYCKPVVESQCDPGDSLTLWKNIAPILKSSLEVLYLRVSTVTYEDQNICLGSNPFSKESLVQNLDLPYYAKYLLIAAYLASYNPAKEDKRLFVKYHDKKRKTLRDVKAKSKVDEQLSTQLGPKPFGVDRLLAIFYSILDEKVSFNSNILVQLSSLVELQLLVSIGNANTPLENQKYKCVVNFDFIQTVSKMVDFNVRKYLYDFSD